MKIRFYLYDNLPLRKTLDLYDVIIVIRSVDDNKYCLQVFLNDCLYKLVV